MGHHGWLTGTSRPSPSWKLAPTRSRTGSARELVWLLEHPPLYTAGTSADAADLVEPDRFRCTRRAGEGSTPITAPASGWPM